MKTSPDGFRWEMEVDTANGIHIGSVNTYLIDEGYQWIKQKDIQKGKKVFYTVGIEINSSAYLGKGLGTRALAEYIRYHIENGHRDICVQTWSGNIRMLKCAERLGFSLCLSETGIRNFLRQPDLLSGC